MIPLHRKVQRKVAVGRDAVVITLEPQTSDMPAQVVLRQGGKKTRFSITIGSLFILLAERDRARSRSKLKSARRGGLL